MAKNYSESILDSSPDKIFDFVEEQLFQNKKNVASNKRKITTMFIGSPGIGKTEVLENFPLEQLAKINSRVIREYIPKFKLHYNCVEDIKNQTEKALKSTSLKKKEIDDILDKILLQPITAVVVVRQSDIIVPEDISGLPSSSSEFEMIHQLYNLASIEQHKGKDEDPDLIEYKAVLKEKIKHSLKMNCYSHEENQGINNDSVIDRNTTKFDFTEWEKKVHDINDNKPHIEHILLVLDDITRTANGSTGILQVLMPVFQQYVVGQRPLPAKCSLAVTSNEEQSEGSDEINYVTKLDQAQKDRLFCIKVGFDLNSWIEYARTANCHESTILFAKHNPKIFKDFWITARRYTQLGQAIYNKFGDSSELFSDDVANNIELIKTLRLQLGDANNGNYTRLVNEFMAFLRDTGNDAFKFIEKLRKGYDKSAQDDIKKLKADGKNVTLNIISHKIKDIITKTVIPKEFQDAIIKLFSDSDVLPENICYSMVEIYQNMIEDHAKLKSAEKGGSEATKIYTQLGKIINNVAMALRFTGAKLQEDFKKNKAKFE